MTRYITSELEEGRITERSGPKTIPVIEWDCAWYFITSSQTFDHLMLSKLTTRFSFSTKPVIHNTGVHEERGMLLQCNFQFTHTVSHHQSRGVGHRQNLETNRAMRKRSCRYDKKSTKCNTCSGTHHSSLPAHAIFKYLDTNEAEHNANGVSNCRLHTLALL